MTLPPLCAAPIPEPPSQSSLETPLPELNTPTHPPILLPSSHTPARSYLEGAAAALAERAESDADVITAWAARRRMTSDSLKVWWCGGGLDLNQKCNVCVKRAATLPFPCITLSHLQRQSASSKLLPSPFLATPLGGPASSPGGAALSTEAASPLGAVAACVVALVDAAAAGAVEAPEPSLGSTKTAAGGPTVLITTALALAAHLQVRTSDGGRRRASTTKSLPDLT